MKVPGSFEKSETIYQLTRRHISESLTLQKLRCENLASRNNVFILRTMILGFPPLYAARSTESEYLIPFSKILFHSGIQHLQFKAELLSKNKRLSALRKFLKAREKVTVPEMATVIGKTIHYICVTFCRLCTLGYIKIESQNQTRRPAYAFGCCLRLAVPKQLTDNTL
jgi:hypothetical protein